VPLSFLDYFERGGPVMYVMLTLSIYGVAVNHVQESISSGMRACSPAMHLSIRAVHEIRGGDINKASRTLSRVKGPIARIMRVAP